MAIHRPVFLKRYFQEEDGLFILEVELNPECPGFELMKEYLNREGVLEELNDRAKHGMLLSEHVSTVALRNYDETHPSTHHVLCDMRVGSVVSVESISDTWFRFVFKPRSSLRKMFPVVYEEFSLCARYITVEIDGIRRVNELIAFDVCAQRLTT